MKTWLKFSRNLLLISLILEIIDYIVAAIFCPEVVGSNLGCMLPTRVVEIIPFYILSSPLNIFGFNQPTSTLLRIIITVIIWFIIGAIIGLIIGKIKNKK